MYAMMGVGAYGSSGVTPPLVAHLWKTYALLRMVYGLEVFNLSNKDILQLFVRLSLLNIRRLCAFVCALMAV